MRIAYIWGEYLRKGVWARLIIEEYDYTTEVSIVFIIKTIIQHSMLYVNLSYINCL